MVKTKIAVATEVETAEATEETEVEAAEAAETGTTALPDAWSIFSEDAEDAADAEDAEDETATPVTVDVTDDDSDIENCNGESATSDGDVSGDLESVDVFDSDLESEDEDDEEMCDDDEEGDGEWETDDEGEAFAEGIPEGQAGESEVEEELEVAESVDAESEQQERNAIGSTQVESGAADGVSCNVTEAETAYFRKLREAETDFANACLEMAELEETIATTKEQIKDQREVVKSLGRKLRTIKRQGEAQLEFDDVPAKRDTNTNTNANAKQDGKATDERQHEVAHGIAGDSSAGSGRSAGHASQDKRGDSQDGTGNPVLPSSHYANWEDVPISELKLESIKGFGHKKLEALADEYPTIGKLEHLRATAGLLSINGIGRAKADAIEDAILTWLTRNRDAEVLAAAVEGVEIVEDHRAQLKQRYQELKASGDLTPKPGFEGAFNSGRSTHEDINLDIYDCPWTPGDMMDAWLAGWLTAEADAEIESQIKENKGAKKTKK